MMNAMGCPEREKVAEINFFCYIDDRLVVTAYDYLDGQSIGWVVYTFLLYKSLYFSTNNTSMKFCTWLLVFCPKLFMAHKRIPSLLHDFSNIENLKASWPWRDLNTQPSDLESDALPLRHRVTYWEMHFKVSQPISTLKSYSWSCNGFYQKTLFKWPLYFLGFKLFNGGCSSVVERLIRI